MMTMLELHKALGERIVVSLKEDLTPEQRAVENEQSIMIMNLGKQMINNANLVLNFEKLQAQTKNLQHSAMPEMIGKWDA